MKDKYRLLLAFIIIFSIALTGCTGPGDTSGGDSGGDKEPDPLTEESEKDDDLPADDLSDKKTPDLEADLKLEELLKENKKLIDKNKDLELQLVNNSNGNKNNSNGNSPSQTFTNFAYDIMQIIKDNDMLALSSHVHPTKGLSFTPNVHIVTGRDLVFTAQEVALFPQDTTVYNWGYYLQAPYDEMQLNFADYYASYIYDEDYINPDALGINHVVNTGDEIDNIADALPNAEYVEFMLAGAPHNTGSDWRSLKLVFEEDNGQKYLIAIVHGQWIDLQSQ